jgi:myo-inositol-1(or 4)-monophosphatase
MTTPAADETQREARARAARRAVSGQVEFLHAEFGRAESHWKSDGTRVTTADVAISENIFRELRTAFPDDQFLSEELPEAEGSVDVSARFAWILDPIDGTNNFAAGIPCCAIALALLENGIPVYGVVYDLGRRTLMHGGPGFGAFDGDRPMAADASVPTSETMVALHSPKEARHLPGAQAVLGAYKIRALGSATLHLAYVAAGLFGGTVDFNVKIWDLAAALPLCAATGVQVVFLGEPQVPVRRFDLKMKRIVYYAAPPALAKRLGSLLGGTPG